MSRNFDIFISYRRRETADKAEHLFSLLEMAGYKGQVSFDRENFDGRFDLEILQRLDNCKDFIVVLAPEILAKLNDEDTHWYEKLARCSVSEFPGVETKMKASGCPKLESITLPACIAELESYSFAYSGIKEVLSLNSTPPFVVDNAFDGINLLKATLLVPLGAKNAYQQEAIWNSFGHIKEQ